MPCQPARLSPSVRSVIPIPPATVPSPIRAFPRAVFVHDSHTTVPLPHCFFQCRRSARYRRRRHSAAAESRMLLERFLFRPPSATGVCGARPCGRRLTEFSSSSSNGDSWTPSFWSDWR
uniref:Secreted protein n=1 Tax=Steinernema glaseri TaxID=37863 RepID=A0A1I7YY02_9BILA